MQIIEIDIVLHDRRTDSLAVFGIANGELPMGVLTVRTDEGIEGNSFLSFPGPGPEAVARQITTYLKPLLVGQNPLDIGALNERMARRERFVDPSAIGTVDVALWDIAGKVAGLPVHRLLGTHRHKVPVYFSSGIHATPEEYADEALYWRERGWRGYKLHPPTAPWNPSRETAGVRSDIAACRAVREAVGDAMALMLDASWAYRYADALVVGRAIEELDYIWYEDPLPAERHPRVHEAGAPPVGTAACDRDDARRAARAAAVDHPARDRRIARRCRDQGRHQRHDEDRAPRRGVQHAL